MSCLTEESVFCFCSVRPWQQRTPPVSACRKAAPPLAPAPPPTQPRAARLETCEREPFAPDLFPSRSKEASASSNAAALWSRLRDATRCVAPRHEGGEVRSAASAGDERPENRAESLEKVESAPGNLGPPREALLPVAPLRRCGTHTSRPDDLPLSARPQNRAQGLEKVESAPEDCRSRRPRRPIPPASRRDAMRRSPARGRKGSVRRFGRRRAPAKSAAKP